MADTPPVLSVHNLRKVYLERAILEDVSFTIHEGERVALIGANGAGKSTLISIMRGRLQPEGGEIRMRRDLSVAALDQEAQAPPTRTVQQMLDEAFTDLHAKAKELDDVHHRIEELASRDAHAPELVPLYERQTALDEELHRREYYSIETRQEELRVALGVPAPDRLLAQLSGGELRRTALARALLADADFLLLDEPTNHLDAETLDWLQDYLARFRGTVFFVTHDRYFLDVVATKMIELHRGRTRTYEGNYTDYLGAKEEESLRAERAESTRQNILRRELDWLRRQPKARTVKAKSRVDRAQEILADKPPPPDPLTQLSFPPGPRMGKMMIDVENLGYKVAGRTLLTGLTFQLGPGERIGIVGPNGAGKTTLIRLLMKELEPSAGSVKHGLNLKFVYADQSRAKLDPDKTVQQEVAGDLEWVQVGGQRINSRAWLARFLFDDNAAAMPIRLLSGGERNRVQMARLLREAGNCMIFDEPTNDLDLPTLRTLEEALVLYEGCALIVSHDRYFLNRTATRILAFRGDGRVLMVEGNYDDYRRFLDQEKAREREARTAAKAPAPSATKSAPAEAPKPAPPAPGAPAAKRKLSNKEQRELESMEALILAAEEALAALDNQLNDPVAFAKIPREELPARLKAQTAARAEVDRLYERWAELGGG